jgi:phosphatidylglycerol:prolipoprotein diacylglycerol transferase
MPSILMGVGIGRIGCFLNGDDYGIAIKNQINPSIFALKFPNLGDGLYRYPVQLWEAFTCFFLVFLCWLNRGQLKKHPGLVGTFSILGYGSSRFWIEFFRGDDRGLVILSYFSPAQVVSLGIICVWVFFWFFSVTKLDSMSR